GVLLLNLPAYAWLRSYHDDQVHTAERYTLGSLADAVMRHPFERLYGTYWNMVLFLPLVFKRKVLPAKRRGSDLSEMPAWLNLLCYSIASSENGLICRGWTLPFGSSVFAICRRNAN